MLSVQNLITIYQELITFWSKNVPKHAIKDSIIVLLKTTNIHICMLCFWCNNESFWNFLFCNVEWNFTTCGSILICPQSVDGPSTTCRGKRDSTSKSWSLIWNGKYSTWTHSSQWFFTQKTSRHTSRMVKILWMLLSKK